MQLALELADRPVLRNTPVRRVPVAETAGSVYAGPAPLYLGPNRFLQPDNVIQTWQAQWLETMGYVDLPVTN